MILIKRITALILLLLTLTTYAAVKNASAESLTVKTAGYIITGNIRHAEYAFNLSTVIDKYFFEICRFIGYKPDYRIHLKLQNSSEKTSFNSIFHLLKSETELSVYTDYEYRRNLDAIHEFTVKRILSDISIKQKSLKSLFTRSIAAPFFVSLSRYMIYGLENRDEIIIRGLVLKNDRLSISEASIQNYSTPERRALFAAFINFSREFYGDRVLAIALKNLTYYGGLLHAHEKITGSPAEVINENFNSYYSGIYNTGNERESVSGNELVVAKIDGSDLLSSDMTGRILFAETNGGMATFFISDPMVHNSFSEAARINIDSSEVYRIDGAFITGGGVAAAITKLTGTLFLVYSSKINIPDVSIFVPYIFVMDLANNQLPGSLVFSASAGAEMGMFTLDFETLQITRISENN